jgi:hypothetical protein
MGYVAQSPAYDEETEVMLFDDWGATDGYTIPGNAP